jgi:DNA adenine methylase
MESIVSRPIIAWPGGKRRLLPHLLKLLPDHTGYVEAFCGGAALLLAKEPSPVEVINDVHGELVRLYRCVQHHLDEFVRQFRWALVSREMFRWAQLQDVTTLTDIQRAARFFYLQKTCFGGKVEGQTFGISATCPPRLNLLRIEEDLTAVHLRLAKVTIENLPWDQLVPRYDRPGTVFFFDPPYWATQGYGVPFPLDQYELLAEVMAGLKGSAILTINDHPDMRRLFGRFWSQRVTIKYTVGRAGRSEPRGELIYRTFGG